VPTLPARGRARRERAPPRSFDRAQFRVNPSPRRGTSVALRRRVHSPRDDDRFQPAPDVKASVSGDGLVLLDVSGGLVLSSNAIGARIWQLLEARHPRGEIARHLADEYAIPVDRAERDVAGFIAALLARGLVAAESRP